MLKEHHSSTPHRDLLVTYDQVVEQKENIFVSFGLLGKKLWKLNIIYLSL